MIRLSNLRSRSAIVLVETLITTTIVSIAIGAVYVGLIALQKSFRAAQHYSVTQAAQMRVLDYVSLDLRRAVNWTPQNTEVTLQVPNFYDTSNPDRPIPRHPKVAPGGEIYYGSSPADTVTVRYYTTEERDASGRRVNNVYRAITTGGTTRTTLLVGGVEEFRPTYLPDPTQKQVVHTKISFPPLFRPFIDSGNAYKDGTTTTAVTMVRNKR